ncbi:MAG TPA: HAMP domain-containing sensor histidine kinase [Gemmatimonadota bacterium]|nr:HAMP domain-containing sensor histidine kinase [Gemmatimonadota bacterium]
MMSHATPRDRRRIGLRALFSLTVLGPVVVVGIIAMWVGGRVVEGAVQERLEEDVQLVARAIQVPLSTALSEGRAQQLYEALGSAFRIRRLYGAAVYDAEGELIARVGAPGLEGSTAPEVGRVAEEGRGGEYGRVGERRVYSYFVPLTSPGGRIEGLLQVTRRRSDIETAVRRVRIQVGAVFAGVWVLMGGLVLLMYQRAVGRHFHRLSAAMAGVERGARDAWVAEGGPKEVAEIAAAFNRMVAGVERAEAQVAEQRRREASLAARLRRSEKLAAIGRLAGGVAHELGTPLAVVDGVAQRLERRGEAVADAGAIREAVGRMEGIVRRLLEFGARASGERRRVSPGALLRGAAASLRGELESRGVTLEIEDGRSAATVRGDRVRLESAVTHLLRNAVQASPAGGTVRAMVEEREDAVRVVVEDSGGGVPEDVRNRLFEPFFTTKAAGQGSGLGLAVVHAVAEEHGGVVEIDDSGLGGARFTLSVPREAGSG